jgi:hypothetical protein
MIQVDPYHWAGVLLAPPRPGVQDVRVKSTGPGDALTGSHGVRVSGLEFHGALKQAELDFNTPVCSLQPEHILLGLPPEAAIIFDERISCENAAVLALDKKLGVLT